MGKFVKLGKKASFFRDPNFDISIAPGEVVELNVRQLNSRRIHGALNGGYLVYTEDPSKATPGTKASKDKDKVEKVEISLEDLQDSFQGMVKAGESMGKILKTFNLSDLKRLAEAADIEVEDSDTKKTIYEALVEDLNGEE